MLVSVSSSEMDGSVPGQPLLRVVQDDDDSDDDLSKMEGQHPGGRAKDVSRAAGGGYNDGAPAAAARAITSVAGGEGEGGGATSLAGLAGWPPPNYRDAWCVLGVNGGRHTCSACRLDAAGPQLRMARNTSREFFTTLACACTHPHAAQVWTAVSAALSGDRGHGAHRWLPLRKGHACLQGALAAQGTPAAAAVI